MPGQCGDCGTTIEYVDAYAANDDGFEFFGGTVNTKYLISSFNDDDNFDWDEGYRGYAVRIETESAQAQDSAKRLAAGDLAITNNIFGTFGAGTTDATLFLSPNATAGGATPTTNYTADYVKANNRINTDPQFIGISRARGKGLDPRLAATSPARTGAKTPPTDGFFAQTDYLGAFKDANWAKGWSAISQLGFLTDNDAAAPDEAIVRGSTSKISNIATRTMLNANATVFAGFVISGTQAQTVIIRAVGPGLGALGVTGTLADPTLELYSGQTVIGTNDDWVAGQSTTVGASVGAFPLPAASKDAVLVKTLQPGNYTVQVKGKGGAGEIIVEVYEVD